LSKTDPRGFLRPKGLGEDVLEFFRVSGFKGTAAVLLLNVGLEGAEMEPRVDGEDGEEIGGFDDDALRVNLSRRGTDNDKEDEGFFGVGLRFKERCEEEEEEDVDDDEVLVDLMGVELMEVGDFVGLFCGVNNEALGLVEGDGWIGDFFFGVLFVRGVLLERELERFFVVLVVGMGVEMVDCCFLGCKSVV
jgi:hypothetical protein